ncbi:hypothetical protein ACFXD5_41015 [Streptomyces sp. NPDC059385]|uniref:hypothetical protein n=1 Tax=Streptomyces sp. NPDC059385 TaxID=3346817 RepID=UPI003678BA1E
MTTPNPFAPPPVPPHPPARPTWWDSLTTRQKASVIAVPFAALTLIAFLIPAGVPAPGEGHYTGTPEEIAYNQGYDWGYAVRGEAHEYRETARANGHLLFTWDLCPAMDGMRYLGLSLPETVGLPTAAPTPTTTLTTIVGGNGDEDTAEGTSVYKAWMNGCSDSIWDEKGEPRDVKNANRTH